MVNFIQNIFEKRVNKNGLRKTKGEKNAKKESTRMISQL